MRKICVISQKGGVGKTTTTVNVAAGISRKDKKVLIIDLDAQSNIGASLNLEGEKNIYHILMENADVRECIQHLGKNLDIIPGDERLTEVEKELSRLDNRASVLKEKLKGLEEYDYIFLDCSPSLGVLNQNALYFAQEAFIPVSTDYLGYIALKKMTKGIADINQKLNHDINVTKIIPTLFDKRNKTCKKYLDKINNEYYELASDPIRINSKLKEAPEHGKSIFSYAKSSRGAKDYHALVTNVLNEEEKILSSYMYAHGSGEQDVLVPLNDPAVHEEFKKKVDSLN